jgi:hypothetical protein
MQEMMYLLYKCRKWCTYYINAGIMYLLYKCTPNYSKLQKYNRWCSWQLLHEPSAYKWSSHISTKAPKQIIETQHIQPLGIYAAVPGLDVGFVQCPPYWGGHPGIWWNHQLLGGSTWVAADLEIFPHLGYHSWRPSPGVHPHHPLTSAHPSMVGQ